MSDYKKYYVAQELIGLPGMPVSRTMDEKSKIRAIQIKAKKEKWQSRKRPGRGAGLEYTLDSLPAKTRGYLQNKAIAAYDEKHSSVSFVNIKSEFPVVTEDPSRRAASLKKWQTKCMNARVYLIGLIEEATADGQGVTCAISNLVKKAREWKLPSEIQAIAITANMRSGKDNNKYTLSDRNLYNWMKLWNESGGKPESLAPADVEIYSEKALTEFVNIYRNGQATICGVPANIPPWLPWFLDKYRTAQKPSKAKAHEDMKDKLPNSIAYPSIDQIYRICKKIPVIWVFR